MQQGTYALGKHEEDIQLLLLVFFLCVCFLSKATIVIMLNCRAQA